MASQSPSQKTSSRAQFATKLGVIAATVGSAVGLGNIWRFPYEAGVHGGAAFMIVDLFFIFIIGVPLMAAEFVIGRHSGANVYGAFKKLHNSPIWRLVGIIGIVASLLILGFYSVVAGWTVDYIVRSLNNFSGASNPTELHAQFNAFTASWESVWYTLGFLFINYLILRRGVQKGIEKMSNIMMPMLFIILLAFCINSLFMPGAKQGLTFLFHPDFSKITSSVILGAMGQAFFSLSLGLGCLITYASYFKRDTNLLGVASITATLDTSVAILSGMIIFPAVFTYGGTPEAGPKLVFEVLPAIFMHMPLGMLWSALFFLLLFLASLTSTISMCEISIAYMSEELGMKRTKATTICILISMGLAFLCALSFGPMKDVTIFGKTFFNLFDFVSSNIMLPIGGFLISVFVGWIMKRQAVNSELASASPLSRFIVAAVIFCLRYIAPACILLVFLAGLGVI